MCYAPVMLNAVHSEAVDRVLACLYQQGHTKLSSFLFGRPGAAIWERNLGTELFVDRKTYTEALMFVREHGASHLRSIAISDLWSMMTTFITDNFWYIGGRTFLSFSDDPYSARVGSADRLALAEALARSPMFSPAPELTMYPLVSVRVTDGFDSDRFFLLAPEELDHRHMPARAARAQLDPTSFPPTLDWTGVRHRPGSWLGVRSPLALVSNKMRSAILGAVALTPPWRQRYMHSGREVFGGRCTYNNGFTVSMSADPHAPPMMDDVTIGAADHAWLIKLAVLLQAEDLASRRRLRALEYFYRAWFLDPRERFPVLCMALDSLVGASSRHTFEAIAFVQNVLGSRVDGARLALLMRVRGAVIHGAAPDVYDSEHYARYYVDYGADPIRDVELVVARCLREMIFEGHMLVHAHPKQALIDNLQAHGKVGPLTIPEAIISTED